MPAVEVQLADALVTLLNDPARNWSQSFSAARSWVPIRRDGELSTLRVAVVPLMLTSDDLARAKQKRDYGLAVTLQKQCDAEIDTTTVADAMAALTEEVFNYLDTQPDLTVMSGWKVRAASRPEIFSPELMTAHAIWFSEIDLEIGGFR